MMVVSLCGFENLLCISVLIILNVGKGVRIIMIITSIFLLHESEQTHGEEP